MLEDESTDDELGVNLQLGERLQINRQPHSSYHNTRARARNSKEHKEYWNGRKKDMCSSSCSTALNPHCSESASSVNGWFVPETPSPYQLGNKKRQNKDRNGEQIAKSKRTCFNVYPEWKEGKVRNRHCKDPQHCTAIPRDCSSVPETSVKAEPSASASTSKANSYTDVNSSGLECLQKDISPDEKYRDFIENIPSFSEIDGTNSSSSNFSSADLLHGNSKRNGSSTLKSYDASLSFPSTSSSGQSFTDTIQNSVSRVTRSIPLGVQYIDSESDDSNRLYAKRGALKGGKQVGSNHFQNKVSSKCSTQLLESDNSDDMGSIHYHNKVIGKCHGLGVVESDDDDSDDSSWQPAFHKHRSRLLLSESEESVEEQSQSLLSRTHGLPILKNSAPSCDSQCSSYKNKTPYIPLPCDRSNDESDHFNSDCCRRHQNSVAHKPKKSSRSRRGPHSKSVNKHFPSCDCNSSGPGGQSKLHSSLRHHRSGSPHPRSLRQRRHSRGLSRTSSGQTNNSSVQSSIKAGLCKEFDPEDSSDMEFFSANSYSESDASESFGGIDISSTISASCSGMRTESSRGRERGISAPESSEEEVSVVFSANPPFRDGNNARHRRHRGTARRRHSRVPSRGSRSQDPVSVSPDPVEQVRQMEEDERLARLLQAQFDAEVVTEDCRPEAHHHHHHTVDSDEDEEIDPVGEISDDMGWIYEESLQSENLADHHHHLHTFSHSPTFLAPALHRGRGRSRPRMAVLSLSTINNASGRGRHVRRRYMHGGVAGDPWAWHFARMMGQTLASRTFDPEGGDYEALWDLAEDVGEAVPRGLNKSEINRLPTRKYISNIGGSDASSSKDFDETVHKRAELNKECQVCLCDYENGDVLRILPCFHEFHTACIDPWLKINHTCPVCRVEVDLEEN